MHFKPSTICSSREAYERVGSPLRSPAIPCTEVYAGLLLCNGLSMVRAAQEGDYRNRLNRQMFCMCHHAKCPDVIGLASGGCAWVRMSTTPAPVHPQERCRDGCVDRPHMPTLTSLSLSRQNVPSKPHVVPRRSTVIAPR